MLSKIATIAAVGAMAMVLSPVKVEAGLADPPIPNWGGNASARYWSGSVQMTDPADEPNFPKWNFTYWYDSTGSIPVDRYNHQPGGSDELCVYCGGSNYKPGTACSVINAEDGVYVQYESAAPATQGCCDCSAKVKAAFGTTNLAIRSDFLRANNPTYLGRGAINGRPVDGWLVYGNDANHYWVTADDTQEMVRYNETKHGALKQWDIRAIAFEQPPASLFQQPAGCTTKC